MTHYYEAVKMHELAENMSKGINVSHNVEWKNASFRI